MFCPECGKPIPEGASFCPCCGHMLSALTVETIDYSQTTTTFTHYQYPRDKRNRGLFVMIGAVVIALIVVLAAFVYVPSTPETGSLNGQQFSLPSETKTIEDAEDGIYATLVSGSGDVTATLIANDDPEVTLTNAMRFTLSESIRSSNTKYVWYVVSETTGTAVQTPLTKTDGWITLRTAKCEGYYFTVQCYNGNILTGAYDFHVRVNKINDYSWKYDGGEFSFRSYVEANALAPYNNPADANTRDLKDYSKCTMFVKDSENTVSKLESDLRELYIKAYGNWSCNQKYADFLLAFVQVNFTYMYDKTLYGYDEYFAYPIQTLAYGGGDCEDTSILCAQLYKCAGFDCAVLILPGHAMAGVAIPDYETPSSKTDDYEILEQTVAGITYYACETTLNSFLPAGLSGKMDGEFLSENLNKGAAGLGSYTFYVVV